MKLKLFTLALLVIAIANIGCKRDDIYSLEGNEEKIGIELFNEIKQVAVSRVNDEGFCDGDAVGIYVVNYDGGNPGKLALKGNQVDNIKFTLNESEGRWVPFEPVYYKDKHTNVDIYGYYPYSEPQSVSAYQFEVMKDQSTEAAEGKVGGYEASDFLWGKAANIVPTDSRVNISFMHRMAGVQVSLQEGTGFNEGEFVGLEKAVLVTNTIRTAEIDLSTGVVTPVGDVPPTGIVPYSNDGNFRAVVVPQIVKASTPLFSITVDGTPYVFRKDNDMVYIPGKLHKFTIEVSKKGEGGVEFSLMSESITAWEADNISHDGEAREYVIVDCQEPGKLREAVEALGKDFTKIKNLKVTGKIDQRDFDFMKNDMTVLESINLKEVKIEEYASYPANEIPINAFYSKSTLLRFTFPEGTTKICGYAFGLTNLTGSLIIPEGITEIGEFAFGTLLSGAPKPSFNGKLMLPSTLKTIDRGAFAYCKFIGELNLPEGLKYLGSSVFNNCSEFSGSLTLPSTLESLEEFTFYACSGFTGSLTIPANITKIGNYCFSSCAGLNGQLVLHSHLSEISDYAFSGCSFRGQLELPEGLTIIGEHAFSGCKFSGNLIIPESVAIIKDYAFKSCSRLTGVVVIPSEIISVASGTFSDCRQLEGVILPKDIEAIGSGAFTNCYQLNSITCKAQNPPYLAADAFNGVAKDNFTVEVPEAAVANYSTAPVWKEFKRFSANRDFSISRNLLRCLNASYSKTFVLRAPTGESWSVESAPDWVTVTPESGVGKMEVTVTVDELARNAGCRDGEIKFLLDGKDYRATMTVNQYDYQYGDGDVVKMHSATQGRGVNLVFMGDCFDAKDIYDGKYYDGVNEAISHFFDVEPYKSYKDYFNVYMIFGVSPDSGVGTVNTIREAKFGSAYSLGGITPDAATCFKYACKAPINDNVANTLITLILNTNEYGGITYMWGDGSAIACCPMSEDYYPYDFRGLVQHEAGGHGFGKLGDEYIYHNAFIQNCTCICCPHVDEFNSNKSRGWYENLSLSGNMYEVPWSHMIFDPQYSNVVDMYEGGYMHMRGVFRSEANSCMNNNIPYFSAISRESIVKRIKEYAGESYTFEDFKQKDVMTPATSSRGGVTVTGDDYYSSSKQMPPVYMGDKPLFNK